MAVFPYIPGLPVASAPASGAGSALPDFSAEAAFAIAEFGESITYTHHGSSPITRTAMVNRAPLRDSPHGGKAIAQGIVEVVLVNNVLTGVASVKPRFDKISVAEQLGGAATKTYTVTKILQQDPVVWKLECGA